MPVVSSEGTLELPYIVHYKNMPDPNLAAKNGVRDSIQHCYLSSPSA